MPRRLDDRLVAGVETQDCVRDEQADECKEHAYSHTDDQPQPHHLAQVDNIAFAPVLGGEDGGAAADAEQHDHKDKKDLVGNPTDAIDTSPS